MAIEAPAVGEPNVVVTLLVLTGIAVADALEAALPGVAALNVGFCVGSFETGTTGPEAEAAVGPAEALDAAALGELALDEALDDELGEELDEEVEGDADGWAPPWPDVDSLAEADVDVCAEADDFTEAAPVEEDDDPQAANVRLSVAGAVTAETTLRKRRDIESFLPDGIAYFQPTHSR